MHRWFWRCAVTEPARTTIRTAIRNPDRPDLAVYETGNLDGPPILVLPGLGAHTAAVVPDAALSVYDDIGHAACATDRPRFNRELAGLVLRCQPHAHAL